MTAAGDMLLAKATELFEKRLSEAGVHLRGEIKPKLVDLTRRRVEAAIRQSQGEDVSLSLTAQESELSSLAITERNWLVEQQRGMAWDMLTLVLSAAV